MEYFDKFWAEAKQHLSNNEPQEAAQSLRFGIQASGLESNNKRLTQLAEALSQIGQQMALTELHKRASAAKKFHHQAFFELGYELIEVGLPDIAVPFLRRLNNDVPGNEAVVQELAVALERAGRNAEARDLLLENQSMLAKFWTLYLLCFNAISAGDLETAKSHAPKLNPTDESERAAALRINRMLARSLDVPSDLSFQDLRGWHYVMNGSILLQLSPHGFNEGMNGRYAYTQDSPASIRRDLERLIVVLQEMKLQPTLLSLPDRNSQIITEALSKMTELPMRSFSPQANGLIIAYDLAQADATILQAIASAAPRLRVFTRAASWTHPPAIVPDIVGLLYQYLVAPWDEHISLSTDGTRTRIPASDEPAAVLAQQIVSASTENLDDPEVPDPLSHVIHLATRLTSPGDHWFDGPVKSSRFA